MLRQYGCKSTLTNEINLRVQKKTLRNGGYWWWNIDW